MLGTAWLTLRLARAALANGHLDEAARLLDSPAVKGHQKSWALIEELHRAIVARAERKLEIGDVDAAWADLARLEAAAPAGRAIGVGKLRQTLVAHGLAEARKNLEAGEPRRAAEVIGRLREHRVNPADWGSLEDAAKDWLLAGELADRGEFQLARQMFERVQRTAPAGPGVDRFAAELHTRQTQFTARLLQLHDALDQRRYRDVLQLAEDVLAVAPEHGEARKARVRAWQSEPETIAGDFRPESDAPAEPTAPPRRFHLWVDGVGGYLVCLAPRVALGQASAEGGADVPLLADVSRFHCSITRDAEGYTIESARPLNVNGTQTQKAALQPGDRLTLGSGCQLVFQRPVPLSATAKLELQSGQRLPLSLDGVLLMAETLVIGPGPQAHILHPELDTPVVLYRDKDGLGVRVRGEFQVDGRAARDRQALDPTATVSGPGFNFALEPAKNKYYR
jgi:tetratricopeptide (TPR) repeat protein